MKPFFLFLCCFFSLNGSWIEEQIQADLEGLTPSDLATEALDAAMEHQELEFVRYQIVEGNLHVHSFTERATESNRRDRITASLKELTRAYTVPDCDFIICLNDGYFSSEEIQAPIFCFSKKRMEKKGILVPDSDCLAHGKKLQVQVKIGNALFPWKRKKEIAFWRGTSTGGDITLENYREFPRFKLVELSSQYPDYIDAKFSMLVQGAEVLPFSHYVTRRTTIPEHIRYKYQILVDGNTCAWSRAYWQLFSNCAMLKQSSDFIQWYYRGLEPWVHYIPIANDLSDLIEKIQWAREHDERVHEISRNAQTFANSYLKEESLLFYYYSLLNAYSKIKGENNHESSIST